MSTLEQLKNQLWDSGEEMIDGIELSKRIIRGEVGITERSRFKSLADYVRYISLTEVGHSLSPFTRTE